MILNIKNETNFKKLKVLVGGREYIVTDSLTVDTSGKSEIEFIPGDKNKASVLLWIIFGFIDMITDLFPIDDNLIIKLFSSAKYTLKLRGVSGNIRVKDMRCSNKKRDGVTYFAPYVYSTDTDICSVIYVPKSCVKQKFAFYFTRFILWLLIFGLCYVIGVGMEDTELQRALMQIALVIFAIISVFQVHRAETCFSKKRISKWLLEKDLEYRFNGDREKPYEPKGFIEKRMAGLVDKGFGLLEKLFPSLFKENESKN